eukprot:6195511-Pleurochrysis_carterae.AAC.1
MSTNCRVRRPRAGSSWMIRYTGRASVVNPDNGSSYSKSGGLNSNLSGKRFQCLKRRPSTRAHGKSMLAGEVVNLGQK